MAIKFVHKAFFLVVFLAALVVLARPFLPGAVAEDARATHSYEYALVHVNEKDELNLESGETRLSVLGLSNALKKYPSEGWEIHSVTPYSHASGFSGNMSGGTDFILIVRR